MSKENNIGDWATGIANAIRDMRGTGEKINGQDFEDEIRAIGPLLDTLDITENNKFDVRDYKNVSVRVENEEYLELKNYFENTSSSYFHIPYGVETLGRGMAVSTIYIPNSVKNIGTQTLCDYTFYDGTFEEWLNIEKNANSNSMNRLSNGNTYLKIKINGKYKELSNENIIFPNNITEIKKGAFNSLRISNGVINIPQSVTKVGEYAFGHCAYIKEINFSGEEFVELGNGCFTYLNYNSSSTKCHINLPKMKISPDNMFSNSYVTSVYIKEGLEELSKHSFYNCKYLESIVLPETLLKIGIYVFNGCTALKEIRIPKNVTEIGSSSFDSMSALKTIIIDSSTPFTIPSYVFPRNTGLKIYVPKGTKETFKSATNWSVYASYYYEKYTVVFNIPSTLLNNENITYSIDDGKTYQQFTNSVLSLNEVATIKIKSTDSSQTILVGTTSGGNDVGTISNSELTFSFTTDTNVYLTIQ